MSDLSDRIAGLTPEKRALLLKRLKKNLVTDDINISRRDDITSYPMSFAQQRMWFLNQWETDSPFYNVTSILQIKGDLDVERLQRCLDEVIQRHEILRAYFRIENGKPVQQIYPTLNLDYPFYDLSQLDQEQRKRQLQIITSRDTQKGFNLNSGPLIRCTFVKVDVSLFVVILTMHHIVTDGWSTGIINREISILYDSFSRGLATPLPEIPLQYSDYAAWEKNWLRKDIIQDQIRYWKEILANPNVYLDLPSDFPRPKVQSFRGAHQKILVPDEIKRKLVDLSQNREVSFFMVLLSVYAILLFRYSGQEDIRIGSPVANRNRTELETNIGLFVNTLVIALRMDDSLPYSDFLKQVKEKILNANSNQDVPFDMLLDSLNISRDMSRSPVFQVMFTMQDNPLRTLRLGDLELTTLETESGTSRVDMTMFVEENVDGFSVAVEYSTDIFSPETITRFLHHYLNLLKAIADEPDCSISRFRLIDDEELNILTNYWNSNQTIIPDEMDLAQQFEQVVEKFDEKIALQFTWNESEQDTILTYRQLNVKANKMANFLIKKGVNKNDFVGIYAERSVDMVIAIMAIVKSGGVYVPIDTSYPKDRISYIREDSKLKILITYKKFYENLGLVESENHYESVICVDEAAILENINNQSGENPNRYVKATDPAYVIYTSGSTGKPKGVVVSQKAITRLVINTNYVKITSSDRVAHVSNPSFDAATFEIWGAFLNGARSVGISKEITLNPKSFILWIKEKHVNILFLTTALFNHFAQIDPTAFETLDYLFFGGEAADVSSARKILHHSPKSLNNIYGPTETTTFATYYPFDDIQEGAVSVPIGKPISNTQVFVLDNNRNPVPIGVPGELYIGGDGVAIGYLNQPELNAEKFIMDPFSASEYLKLRQNYGGLRVYKTGDRVRLLADGNIDFIGRVDFQVKLRGLRIELGEIESAISHYPTIQQNVVLLREDIPGDKKIVAYLVPGKDQTVNLAELRKFLKETLPEFMLPSAYVYLEKLPINQNGKVDRKALPPIDQARSELDKVYIRPTTAVEMFLAERWERVLGVTRVGIYDDFFEIGGDSLKAAVLMNRLQEELKITAHVRAIFMAPNIAELSMYLTEYFPEVVQEIASRYESSLEKNAEVDDKKKPEIAPKRILSELDHTSPGVDENKIEIMNSIIQPLLPRDETVKKFPDKNPTAVFVISPPRSGSTLLRTMLAGHPSLFSPPELDLLSFNTLSERRKAFEGKYVFWLEGVERAIIDLRNCSADEARETMRSYEEQGMSTKDFYRQLQKWISDSTQGQKRLLVDKTPVYALDYNILSRAEEDFNNPIYIHLVRNPYASIYSFIEAKLDGVFFRYDHPFSQRELAEMVWVVSHRNILNFLENIPQERKLRVAFEDLVTTPKDAMLDICQLLGIDYYPEMINPYDGDRMTSGVRPGNQMVGDFKFYLRNKIDPKAADRWKKFHAGDFLSSCTWEIAEKLGYEKVELDAQEGKEKISEIKIVDRNGELSLSYAQQRLWFLDQWQQGNATYIIPFALRLSGKVNYHSLENSLNEIIRRHEVLRSRIISREGKPELVIDLKMIIPVNISDLSGLSSQMMEKEIDWHLQQDAKTPFDLEQGPLIRAKLLKLSQTDHIFTLSMHHIIADGWSVGIWIREFAALYSAFANNRSSDLDPISVQYLDYAAWQKEWLKGPQVEKQMEYWRKKLSRSSQFLELPTDHPRQSVLTQNGERFLHEIPEELSQRIRKISRQENVTLFMSMLAIFYIQLYRYSSQETINIGTPIANRRRAEFEKIIGFFVNTLVLSANISRDKTFAEILKEVHRVSIEAFENQDVPFEKLVDDLQVERSMSHSPLFQVMFTVQDAPITKIDLQNLSLQQIQTDSKTAKFDLLITVIDRGDLLKVSWEYNSDLFERVTIERMAGHYVNLVRSAWEGRGEKVGKLKMLGEGELRKIVEEWNQTEREIPEGKTLSELFTASARRVPERDSVIGDGVRGEERLSYRELEERGNQVGRVLRKRGVKAGEVVGLYIDRSVEMVIGLIGILKAGGAYLPLDRGYPEERLKYILGEVGEWQGKGVLVLTVEKEAKGIPEGVGEVVLLDGREVMEESREGLGVTSREEDLAYVIYTSGTSGRPKGVMIEQRNVVNLWVGLRESIYGGEMEGKGERVSLNAPLMFDASVQQWVMLMSGETLVVVPREVRQDGGRMKEWIEEKGIEVLDCVPTQMKVLMGEGLFERVGKLRAVLPGGEAIDEGTWEELRGIEGVEFYNMYGPTECTVDATVCRVKGRRGGASIGKGIVNTRLYVVDEGGEIVGEGVGGELWIGGKGVGRGYVKGGEQMREKYVSGKWKEGERVYRTGDRVRWRGDGNLEYMGRMDDQVKVRGYRIELGEIETVLKKQDWVKEAVVLVRGGKGGEKQLVGYVELERGKKVTVNEIRGELKKELPEYMVPGVYVEVEAMPLLPNGKVDRRGLMELGVEGQMERGSEKRGPRTEGEAKLTKIWEEVLGVEGIGVRDNFFELGGDSILTIQVIAKARKAGMKVSPRQMFEAQTVEELARVVGEGEVEEEGEQGEVEGEAELTPIQRWFFEQEYEEPWHWNQAMLLEVNGRLEEEKLREAVGEVLRQHDGLRTRFWREGGEWKAEIQRKKEGEPVEVVDLSEKEEEESREEMETHMEGVQRSLKLETGELVKVVYYDRGEGQKGRLLLVIHHLVVDGVSWRILLEDLQQVYQDLETGRKAILPAKTASVIQWGKLLTLLFRNGKYASELRHWISLENDEGFQVPVDYIDGRNDESSLERVQFQIDREQTEKLVSNIHYVYGTDINQILLSSLAITLFGWTGEKNISLDYESHGRPNDSLDLSRTVGWFTSIYPIKIDLDDAKNIDVSLDIGHVIQAVKKCIVLQDDLGQGYGILKYYGDLKTRNLMAGGIRKISYNYHGQINSNEENKFKICNEYAGITHSQTNRRPYLLEFVFYIQEKTLIGNVLFSDHIHKKATVEKLVDSFRHNINAIIDHCLSQREGSYSPSDFPGAGLSEDELSAIMEEIDTE